MALRIVSVEEKKNLGQPTGRGLPDSLVSFCQLDTSKGQLEEGPPVKGLPSSSWPMGMSVGCFLDGCLMKKGLW